MFYSGVFLYVFSAFSIAKYYGPPERSTSTFSGLESDYWGLVFRARAGNNQSYFGAYLNTSHGCSSAEVQVCSQHYRSDVLDHWESLCVYQVKIEVYSHCKLIGTMLYDGRDSNIFNIFSEKRILFGTWTNIAHDANNFYFGFSDGELTYAKQKAAKIGHTPVFLYTTQSIRDNPNTKIKQAEVVAFFLKARSLIPC